MSNDTPITVIGNLTADPELRFTPAGAAVASFTVAATPRKYNSQTKEWEDGEPMFLGCSVWREAAENVAESLTKGMRVIVTGKLRSRSYETRGGEKRTVFEIEVDEVGPSLRWSSARVTRNDRQQGGGGRYDDRQQQGQRGGQYDDRRGSQGRQQPQADPWASAGRNDEPPF